jgi:CTP synthase (UTP-ammonia lyase)
MIDKVLLSIIDAYRVLDDTNETSLRRRRERRLLAAKKALFEEASKPGQAEVDDQPALLTMAMGYIRDRQKEKAGGPRPRSIRKLAQAATFKTYGNSSDAIIERLRKKFANKRTNRTIMFLAAEHDYVVEMIELQQLQELQKLFNDMGIKMNLSEFERP